MHRFGGLEEKCGSEILVTTWRKDVEYNQSIFLFALVIFHTFFFVVPVHEVSSPWPLDKLSDFQQSSVMGDV